MKTKACALILAVIMLFSFVCTAENGYVTISDPYYTDGTNVYDLTGLSANLSYAAAENVVQFILRAVTSYGQTSAGIQIENERVSLYGDGFTARYSMTLDDLTGLLSEATDISGDFSQLISGLPTENAGSAEQEMKSLSLAAFVSEIYNSVYKDGSQLANAKSGQVDTFLHNGMSAFVVPIEVTAEELDAFMADLSLQIDAQGLMNEAVADFLGEEAEADESGEIVLSAAALYEKNIKPLILNVKGKAYYGENDIFAEINLCSGDTLILPIFFEVTNTETPSLYLNIPLEDEDSGELVIYATVESSEDGRDDYLEIGLLENERTVALATYQVYENAGMPVQDLYIGLTAGNELYNFAFVNATDNKTARNIHASAYLNGIEAQLSYSGVITDDYGDKNEHGTLQLATNIGIQGKVSIGFGNGSGAPSEFIPENIPEINISSMTDADSQRMMADFQNLLNGLMTSLMMGVPGFGQLIGAEDAQG